MDAGSRRLSKGGQSVRIQDQPFQMLLVLLEKPGEVVSREELRRRLWAEGTFVDFDNSLNAAMNKLREALNELDKDRAFLTKGGVFTDAYIDAYIDLKMQEVTRFRMTTHPLEFDMYYSL